MTLNLVARPFVIFAGSHHKFHFITRGEMVDVRPKIFVHFAAARRFQIHDPMDARIDLRDIVGAAGFEQNRITGIAQHRHQRQHIFLEQRLSTGDLDQRTATRGHRFYDLAQSFFLSLVKRILSIAIVAAQIAECQPHEHTGSSYPRAFTLNRVIDFVNRQRLCAFGYHVRNVLREESQRK